MRLENSIRNTKVAFIMQLITIILSFANRTVFIGFLSAEYLGLNGLFSNILTVLSLAELGVGSAITYNLYKPLAENDITRIKKLMNFYKMVYAVIGFFILCVGLILTPIVEYLVNEPPVEINLKIVFLLFVFNSATSYFFTYKRSIINADQKAYVDSINRCQQSIVQFIIQNLILVLTRNYILYLAVQITLNFIFNALISYRANKMYPFLKENKEKLEISEIKKIFKDVSALMLHRLGSIVVTSTDYILISTFVNLTAVGIYSNYTMIISAVKNILTQIINSITGSVGNLNAVEKPEKRFEVYKKLYFFDTWIVGFCAIAFYVLLNPFIKLWIGEEYLLSKEIVFVICLNFYVCDPQGIRSMTNLFKDSMGLFWNDRFKPIFESLINLVVSIVLLKQMGFIGVLLGTLVATITTDLWVEPYVVFKHGFNKPLRSYFELFFKYGIVVFVASVVTTLICNLIDSGSVISFIGMMVVVAILPNLIFMICFRKMEEYRYFKGVMTKYLGNILLKVKKKS